MSLISLPLLIIQSIPIRHSPFNLFWKTSGVDPGFSDDYFISLGILGLCVNASTVV